jgi:hypothetical protein
VEILENRTLLSFLAAPAYTVDPQPTSVAVADFNGDGHPDLAVANLYDTTISILLCKGDSTFQAAQSYTVGNSNGYYSGGFLVVGDFNRDGHPDLAVTNNAGDVIILLGNGDGSFQAPQSYAVGHSLGSIAVGDFTGDGHLDLAVAYQEDSNSYQRGGVSLLLGNGDGTFQTPRSYALGFPSHSLAVGDFDGDGHLDLAMIDDLSGTVAVLLGKGDGSFQPAHNLTAGRYPAAVAVGDFNRDGHPDLAVANSDGTVSILLGKGDGSFQAAQGYATGGYFAGYGGGVAVGDFNGDGKIDLAVSSGGVSILLGNGDGTFQPAQNYAAGDSPSSVAVGDFDGDGHLDLAVANYGYYTFPSGNVSVLLGNGDGTFKAARSYGHGSGPVAVGDFNGDGHPDLAEADGGSVDILLGNADGTFQPPQSYRVDYFTAALAVGDLNGDGHLDLVVAGLSGPEDYHSYHNRTVTILLGNGDGMFQPPQSYALSMSTQRFGFVYSSLAIADFKGDGHLDIAVGNPGDDAGNNSGVSVLLGNGDGTFQPAQTYLAGFHPSSIAVGDFNGDGIPDLAVTDAAGGTLSILLGKGDGSFPTRDSYAIGNYPSTVAGDFNGDGKLDFAVVHDGMLTIWFGNGDGTFQAGPSYAAGIFPAWVLAGDFNRDGRLDLATVSDDYGSVSIFLGNGDGSFQAAQTYSSVGSFPGPAAVGDFNGDGLPDLAISTWSGVTILLNGADWGGGGAGALPPGAGHPLGALQLPEPEQVGALLASLKPQIQLSPSTPLLQSPTSAVQQRPVATGTSEPTYPEAALPPRPMFQTRQARDAIFAAWADHVGDDLAWNMWK